jgi:hypothetical protein
MLVVTSNWCVTDGSLAAGPAPGLVARLRGQLRLASLRAGIRGDGRYRPLIGITVVFAGDTFDWLTSLEWTGDARPWESSRRAAAARERVVAGSWRLAGRLVATLSAWGRRGIDVPLADQRGRPLAGSRGRVPVRVVILRGDRDRWIDRIAFAGPRVALSVGTEWTDGDVLVRHGQEIETLWHDGGPPTLGESLAVELISRFGRSLQDADGLGRRLPAMLRLLAAGRLVDAPCRLAAWMAARNRDGSLSAPARGRVIDAWNRAVAAWHRAVRRLDLGGGEGVDLPGRLATALTLDARWQHELPMALAHEEPPCEEPLAETAERPPASSGACVVLGHPPAGFAPSSHWKSRVLCIGPAAVRRSGETHPGLPGAAGLAALDPPGMIRAWADPVVAPVPLAAHVARGTAEPWLDWLSLGGAGPGGRQYDSAGCGIWRSRAAPAGQHIVDAA